VRAWLAPVAAAALFAFAPPAAAAANGAACALSADCDSTICVDGVCCDRACSGTCEACVAGLKQSGLATGTCGPVRAGTDPDSECAAEARTTCGKTGSCDGLQAACAKWPLGTPCHDPVDTRCQCNNVTGWICSGTGTCYDETTFVQCGSGDYQCLRPDGTAPSCSAPEAGACATPCTADTDCKTNYRCLAGACVAKLPVKAACSANLDCAGGSCADGVCCNAPCGRQCEACNLPGLVGTCSQVTGAPVAPRLACAGSSPCQGACGGQRDQCDYPGSAVACGASACVNDSVKHADTCDGTGKCQGGSTTDCGDYSCDPTKLACFTECTKNADCAGAGHCNVSGTRGTCNPATVTCDGAWRTRDVAGTIARCGGYKCIAGVCQSKCAGAADCDAASGYTCSAGQRCVHAGADGGVGDASGATGASGGAPGSAGAGAAAGSGAGGVAGTGAGGHAVRDSGSSGAPGSGPDAGAGKAGSPSGAAASRDSGGCGCRTAPGDRSRSGSLAIAIAGLLILRRRVKRG
jgi:hypothetical protein